MAKHRAGRINEEMKKEISAIVMGGLKDPRITAMTTITAVEVTSDLSYAKVFTSIFGTDEEKQDTLEGLKSSVGFIRHELGKRIQIRKIPQLIIVLDETLDRGMHIDELIKQANAKKDE